jgi:hypothetical protein
MPQNYYSMNGAYGPQNLTNTPSQYENLTYPCITRYPEDPISLYQPTSPFAAPIQQWDLNYQRINQAYQFPRPTYALYIHDKYTSATPH